jgi:hypothetical protein
MPVFLFALLSLPEKLLLQVVKMSDRDSPLHTTPSLVQRVAGAALLWNLLRAVLACNGPTG